MTSLFGHNVRSDLLALYIADVSLCFVAMTVALSWQAGIPLLQGGPVAATVALACGLISGASGLYQPEAFARARQLLRGVAAAGLLLLVLLPVLALLAPMVGEGMRERLLAIPLAVLGALVLTRLAYGVVRGSGLLVRRIGVLRGPEAGPDPVRQLLAQGGGQGGGHVEIALDIAADAPLDAALDPARLRAARVTELVLAPSAALPEALRARCEAAGIPVLDEAEFLERQLARVDIERLPAGWLARTHAMREGALDQALRRLVDVALGLTLLVVTLPLLLVTALAIKLDSPGPVFYRQERIGRGGRPFMLFKFRSMVVDAEAAGTPVWASQGDPRVTRVGRFIRLTRIDEVPQVLNVLRGEMAFVGPRPERPAFVARLAELIPHYADRSVVKPGITGWAQVNYPYGASVEDARMKLAYDLYYVRRRSLFLDLLILVATVRVVLFREGSR